MTEDKEREYNKALGMCMLAMAMLMNKLKNLGDKPTADESFMMDTTISVCGDLIDRDGTKMQ